jgi:hypothetical protein
MAKENWQKGYKEVKNVIHNDVGITKEEILNVFREVAKEEVGKLVSENSSFLFDTLRDVVQNQMVNSVSEHRYPKVGGHIHHYRGSQGRGIDSFKDYVSGVMKEEIVKKMEEQFEVNINVTKK